MSVALAPQAPGAQAAKVCGILAILFALTVVGFPVALVLGVVALVQQAKAKRLVRAAPDAYQAVPATGQVTGIIGLVLPLLLLPVAGWVSAVALPSFLAQRERAREVAVQANLNLARQKAEAAVLALHAKAPGQVPSAEIILRDLARDPDILALRNPVTPGAPALQRGRSGPLGTVMVTSSREEVAGVTTWSIRFRAMVSRGSGQGLLEAEVVTHTEEKVQGRTEDGWDVVSPPVEPPAPPN